MTIGEMTSRPELLRTIQNGGSRRFNFTILEHSLGRIEWTTKGSDKV